MSIKAAVPVQFGFFPPLVGTSTGTKALSASTTRLALGFRLPATGTLSKLKAFVSTKAGTPSSSEIKLEIFADLNGQPTGTALETSTTTGGHTAGAWSEWTGFSGSYTRGVQYWAVFSNTNGTPASNNVTIRFMGASHLPTIAAGVDAHQGWGKWESSDSGSTWITAIAGTASIRLELSGSLFAGFPYSQIASNTTDQAYATRAVGVLFTIPSGYPTVNVLGAALGFGAYVGTPPDNVVLKLYTSGASPTLIATSDTIPVGTINALAPGYGIAYFSAAQALSANTSYRLVAVTASNVGDSSNAYRLTEYTIDNDANSRSLVAFANQKTYFDGTNWTDTNTATFPWYLIPDRDGEFTLPAAGGGGGAVIGSSIIQGLGRVA